MKYYLQSSKRGLFDLGDPRSILESWQIVRNFHKKTLNKKIVKKFWALLEEFWISEIVICYFAFCFIWRNGTIQIKTSHNLSISSAFSSFLTLAASTHAELKAQELAVLVSNYSCTFYPNSQIFKNMSFKEFLDLLIFINFTSF